MKRKAFTLVELLIVIVVIGVLAVMIMLSSNEAVSSAKASNVVTNLTHIKKAVIAWYIDNLDHITYGSTKTDGTDLKFFFNGVRYNSIQDALANQVHSYQTSKTANTKQTVSIMNYLQGASDFNKTKDNADNNWNYLKDGGYGVNDAGTEAKRKTWFTGYRFQPGEDTLKKKLWGRRKTLNLIFSKGVRPNNGTPIQSESDLVSAKSVWLRIQGDAVLDGKDGNLNDKS